MRRLAITIDTEVDRDSDWRISNPVRFDSVTRGVPEILQPLFSKYGARPTYLLSPEIIENAACASIFKSVRNSEVGAHLHAEFVEPERLLFPDSMAGQKRNTIQTQYSEEVEREKLRTLTNRFASTFGFQAKAFRAGRYAIRSSTLDALASLGYAVDSSVTPGLRWDYPEGVVDHTSWTPDPRWVTTKHGSILELPISIWPGAAAVTVQKLPRPARALITRIAGRAARYHWLRPGWTSGRDLVRLARAAPEQSLVLMMHSVEVIPGASPHAPTKERVDEIVADLEQLLRFWVEAGNSFVTLSEIAAGQEPR